MKLKAIIASLVLLVVASANVNAALTSGGASNNLAFTFLNAGGDTSYTLDTGWSLASIIDGTSGNLSTNVLTDINSALGVNTLDSVVGGQYGALGVTTDLSPASNNSLIMSVPTGTTPPLSSISGNLASNASGILNSYLDDSFLINGALEATSGQTFWNAPSSYLGNVNNLAPSAGATGMLLDLIIYELVDPGGFTNATYSATVLGTVLLGTDGLFSFTPVPVPAAVWLFGTALAAFFGFSRRKTAQVTA